MSTNSMALSASRWTLLVTLVAALAATPASGQFSKWKDKVLQTGVKVAQRPSFSDADEARMAQENARQFEAEAVMWDDPGLEAYLTGMLQRLVAVAEPRPFSYRVRIVNDATVNAFTFGGGLIYVHAGLIARMENEGQLAMVLAHELAHVTKRHVPRGLESQYGMQVLGDTAAVLASGEGVNPDLLTLTYQYTMTAAINGHGRKLETEADEVGLDYLYRAGYDPRTAPDTFSVLYKEYGDPPPLKVWLYSNHPSNRARYEHTTQLVAKQYSTARTHATNDREFERRTRALIIEAGKLDYQEKRFATARAMFEKAASIEAEDPLPHYFVGKIILETGGASLDAAIAHLSTAIKVDAAFAPAYRELGLAYYRKQDKRGAIAAFERCLELAPDAADAAQLQRFVAELKQEARG